VPLSIAGDQIKHEEYPNVIEIMLDWFLREGDCKNFSSNNENDVPF